MLQERITEAEGKLKEARGKLKYVFSSLIPAFEKERLKG